MRHGKRRQREKCSSSMKEFSFSLACARKLAREGEREGRRKKNVAHKISRRERCGKGQTYERRRKREKRRGMSGEVERRNRERERNRERRSEVSCRGGENFLHSTRDREDKEKSSERKREGKKETKGE